MVNIYIIYITKLEKNVCVDKQQGEENGERDATRVVLGTRFQYQAIRPDYVDNNYSEYTIGVGCDCIYFCNLGRDT